jgi:hypothetical protein
LTLIWTSPPSAIIFAGKAKGVKDGRKDSIKHSLKEINKMNSQAGARYRESGLVLRPIKDSGYNLLR